MANRTKGGVNNRRKGALERLESKLTHSKQILSEFNKLKPDEKKKEEWENLTGVPKQISRMEKEIATLKARITT